MFVDIIFKPQHLFKSQALIYLQMQVQEHLQQQLLDSILNLQHLTQLMLLLHLGIGFQLKLVHSATEPTISPTNYPSADPTIDPTSDPTTDPTVLTVDHSFYPTTDPTTDPTTYHSFNPTTDPTLYPTIDPTEFPTSSPSQSPSSSPTSSPLSVAESLSNNIDEYTDKYNPYIYSAMIAIPIILIITIIIAKFSTNIGAKIKHVDDQNYDCFILFSIQIFDLYSDIIFTVQLYQYYAFSKSFDSKIPSDTMHTFYILLILSTIFTIVPYI
eukprot:431707_1